MEDKSIWQYDGMTWLEMRDTLLRIPQPVVAIPFGTVEDHGPHLPLSADNDILMGILNEVARRSQGDLLVTPLIPFGLDEHHMDFPGTISIEMEICLAYVSQVAISIARHGFTHILIVNGHGSNQPVADLAARKCVLATGFICASATVNAAVDPVLVQDVVEEQRKGGPGSIAHAGEYETSMMLHLAPALVHLEKATRDIGQLKLKYFNWDHPEPSAFSWQDYWSRFTKDGICGDPTVASAESGKVIFEATVTRFLELVREFQTIPIRDRVDHHK
jgi:creatinine amidohydrolase